MPQPHEQNSEAVEQAKARAQRLSFAFLDVFGSGSRRSAAQKLVMEHLEACVHDGTSSYSFSDGKDGLSIIARGIHIDGAKTVLRIIQRQLEIAAKSKDSPKTKPTVRR